MFKFHYQVLLLIFLCPVVYCKGLENTLELDLEQARLSKQGQYQVRTQYLSKIGTPVYTNRLILENSPYLLQHAHNPVNWYAWGKVAFDAARRENKPIFLSIGYSTCHWCHVMETESFDNEEVARILNKYFISIKVDRDLRPDIDDFYIKAALVFSGKAGWPVSSFLTHDSKPFLAASYFSRPDFVDLLEQVQDKWTNDHQFLLKSAIEIYQEIQEQQKVASVADTISPSLIDQTIIKILSSEDKRWGGVDHIPKFPRELILMLLLRKLKTVDDFALSREWEFISRELDALLQGGIYDQVAGGFHRYATDKAWRIPHFEKMLFNQALLVDVYTNAWFYSGDNEYKRIVIETLNYVLNEMRSDKACFYSATDADSENKEGKFYLWHDIDIASLFTPGETDFVRKLYGIRQEGNFNHKNILYLPNGLESVAEANDVDYQILLTKIAGIRQKLYQKRAERIPPFKDKKQIVEWSALMISALANSGLVFNTPEYIRVADQCAEAIWQHAINDQGSSSRLIDSNKSSASATLGDYGHYIQAMLTLYDVTDKDIWLTRSHLIYLQAVRMFQDKKSGSFFNTAFDQNEQFFLRNKDVTDNTIASGNSAMLMAMVMLHQRSGQFVKQSQIKEFISYNASTINQNPIAFIAMLAAVDESLQANIKPVKYAAKGNIKIHAEFRQNKKQLTLTLMISNGWHINSTQPLQSNLIPTTVELVYPTTADLTMQYPEGHLKSLSFSQQELSLYEDELKLTGNIVQPVASNYLLINIRLQACDDKMCLPPETVRIAPIYLD
jgi:uncharacterized protein